MGGLLSAIVPYVKGDQLTGRYRIFLAQIVLKTMAGALTAFMGILLLEGGVLAGLTPQQGSKDLCLCGLLRSGAAGRDRVRRSPGG